MDFKNKIKSFFSSENTKKDVDQKHPVILEYEDLLTKSNIPRDEWDKLFIEFYNQNINFIDDGSNTDNNQSLVRIIGIKIIYLRILHDKDEYKQGYSIAKYIENAIQKLDRNDSNFLATYINGKSIIAINLANNRKYFQSNKIFNELIEIDGRKDIYKRWLTENTHNLLLLWCIYPVIGITGLVTVWNLVMTLLNAVGYYLSLPFSIIFTLILVVGIVAYLNVDKVTKYLINRKYK